MVTEHVRENASRNQFIKNTESELRSLLNLSLMGTITSAVRDLLARLKGLDDVVKSQTAILDEKNRKLRLSEDSLRVATVSHDKYKADIRTALGVAPTGYMYPSIEAVKELVKFKEQHQAGIPSSSWFTVTRDGILAAMKRAVGTTPCMHHSGKMADAIMEYVKASQRGIIPAKDADWYTAELQRARDLTEQKAKAYETERQAHRKQIYALQSEVNELRKPGRPTVLEHRVVLDANRNIRKRNDFLAEENRKHKSYNEKLIREKQSAGQIAGFPAPPVWRY